MQLAHWSSVIRRSRSLVLASCWAAAWLDWVRSVQIILFVPEWAFNELSSGNLRDIIKKSQAQHGHKQVTLRGSLFLPLYFFSTILHTIMVVSLWRVNICITYVTYVAKSWFCLLLICILINFSFFFIKLLLQSPCMYLIRSFFLSTQKTLFVSFSGPRVVWCTWLNPPQES